MNCPRCKQEDFNTFTMTRRYNKKRYQVPVNACKKCGFLWVEDSVMLELAAWEVKELFIKDIKAIGKAHTDTS
jgi:predicted Zn-ribbon and HTH transcriptional regulator